MEKELISKILKDYTSTLDSTIYNSLIPCASDFEVVSKLAALLPKTSEVFSKCLASTRDRAQSSEVLEIHRFCDVAFEVDAKMMTRITSHLEELEKVIDVDKSLNEQGQILGLSGIVEGVKINLTVVKRLMQVNQDTYKFQIDFIFDE